MTGLNLASGKLLVEIFRSEVSFFSNKSTSHWPIIIWILKQWPVRPWSKILNRFTFYRERWLYLFYFFFRKVDNMFFFNAILTNSPALSVERINNQITNGGFRAFLPSINQIFLIHSSLKTPILGIYKYIYIHILNFYV